MSIALFSGVYQAGSSQQVHHAPDAFASQSRQAATQSSDAASSGREVSISPAAQRLAQSDSAYVMNTSKGDRVVDLATFFEPPDGPVDLDSIPLLLPSEANVKTLQSQFSKVFPDFLQSHGIPEAPAEIRFDDHGQLVLPADYAHADTLKAALTDEPALMKQLRTVNALASHVAALQEALPFHEEYARATSQAQIDAVIAKYQYLFDDYRRGPEVALAFAKSGNMNVIAGDQALV
ncbi:MAG TPA: hypothetical protein VIC26_05240 [Marinagarivorans sp.]